MAPKTRAKRELRVETESESGCSSTLSPKCLSNCQTLTQLSDNWFEYINEVTTQLNNRFDKLDELRLNNTVLEMEAKAWQKNTISKITEQIGIESNDIDECLRTVRSMNTKSKNELTTTKRRLKEKKLEKKETEKDLKIWTKRLDESKTELNELMENKDEKESKELAKLMNCRYKVSANERNVLIDFEDRKRGQKLISGQSKDVSNEFWLYLNNKYDL